MVKLKAPLFSMEVSGTIAKALTFGKNQAGNWVRGYFKKVTTRNAAQSDVRDWFKAATARFVRMAEEERFLWRLALLNYKDYGARAPEFKGRTAKCLYLHRTLSDRKYEWFGSPFPPCLWQMLASDEIAGYNQLISDVETLTGLVFCTPVKPYFFRYLGSVKSKGHPGFGMQVAGCADSNGLAIALMQDTFERRTQWQKDNLIGHELTHCIMNQHVWNYRLMVAASEEIANECGARIANNDLAPVYTYHGKTLSEIVGVPACP